MEGVWLIQANCGDYYCGCGGGHTVGIATTSERADEIKAEAEVAEKRYGIGTKHERSFKSWPEGVSTRYLRLDQLLEGE